MEELLAAVDAGKLGSFEAQLQARNQFVAEYLSVFAKVQPGISPAAKNDVFRYAAQTALERAVTSCKPKFVAAVLGVSAPATAAALFDRAFINLMNERSRANPQGDETCKIVGANLELYGKQLASTNYGTMPRAPVVYDKLPANRRENPSEIMGKLPPMRPSTAHLHIPQRVLLGSRAEVQALKATIRDRAATYVGGSSIVGAGWGLFAKHAMAPDAGFDESLIAVVGGEARNAAQIAHATATGDTSHLFVYNPDGPGIEGYSYPATADPAEIGSFVNDNVMLPESIYEQKLVRCNLTHSAEFVVVTTFANADRVDFSSDEAFIAVRLTRPVKQGEEIFARYLNLKASNPTPEADYMIIVTGKLGADLLPAGLNTVKPRRPRLIGPPADKSPLGDAVRKAAPLRSPEEIVDAEDLEDQRDMVGLREFLVYRENTPADFGELTAIEYVMAAIDKHGAKSSITQDVISKVIMRFSFKERWFISDLNQALLDKHGVKKPLGMVVGAKALEGLVIHGLLLGDLQTDNSTVDDVNHVQVAQQATETRRYTGELRAMLDDMGCDTPALALADKIRATAAANKHS